MSPGRGPPVEGIVLASGAERRRVGDCVALTATVGAVVVDLARADVTADEDPATAETVTVRALVRGLLDPTPAVEEQRLVSHWSPPPKRERAPRLPSETR
ncbi:hypothetical protein CH267_01070 [Rhodococcus sp. 06-621-2]|nr:hypothetical protein CH267_01070 [Rhodococcus sp. 06-621-2]